ncbi:MAG: orotate phosphoribosyltransferase [Deinococcales bacterium]
MTRDQLAAQIHHRSLLRGHFVLRSGATSDRYFDKYLFESDPPLLEAIAEAMAPLVPEGVDAIAGLELGGIPLAVMLSQRTGLPTRFVRKKAKEYGTRRLAEGGDVAGLRLLVVEDVITSGGQVVLSTHDLRALGATVERALCVIDREAGGVANLAEAGVQLTPLFTMSALERAAGA